jgi:hypothetical protein
MEVIRVYIHLGGNKMIRSTEVVAILDAGTRRAPHSLTPFLEAAQASGRMETISHEEVKSYVVTKEAIYPSPISSTTLMKRAQPPRNGSHRSS